VRIIIPVRWHPCSLKISRVFVHVEILSAAAILISYPPHLFEIIGVVILVKPFFARCRHQHSLEDSSYVIVDVKSIQRPHQGLFSVQVLGTYPNCRRRAMYRKVELRFP